MFEAKKKKKKMFEASEEMNQTNVATKSPDSAQL